MEKSACASKYYPYYEDGREGGREGGLTRTRNQLGRTFVLCTLCTADVAAEEELIYGLGRRCPVLQSASGDASGRPVMSQHPRGILYLTDR